MNVAKVTKGHFMERTSGLQMTKSLEDFVQMIVSPTNILLVDEIQFHSPMMYT